MSAQFQKARVKSMIAEADLSAKKYHVVKLGTAQNTVVAAGAGEGLGILMNAPQLGEYAEVALLGGGALGVSGAAFAKGAELAADANGKLVAAVSTDKVVAIALEAAAGADEWVELERVLYVKP